MIITASLSEKGKFTNKNIKTRARCVFAVRVDSAGRGALSAAYDNSISPDRVYKSASFLRLKQKHRCCSAEQLLPNKINGPGRVTNAYVFALMFPGKIDGDHSTSCLR